MTTKTGGNFRARRLRSGSLAALIAARVGQAILAMFGASIIVWTLLPLAPGDPAMRILQARGVENPRDAEIAQTREELQLDKPLMRWTEGSPAPADNFI